MEVGPLSRRVMLSEDPNPYLRHDSTAFASSILLYPHAHQLALQLAFPNGEEYGLITFRVCNRAG